MIDRYSSMPHAGSLCGRMGHALRRLLVYITGLFQDRLRAFP